MKHYVGVKMEQAEPAEKNGEPGYAVEYEDGYKSWSPRDVFERFCGKTPQRQNGGAPAKAGVPMTQQNG